VRWKELGRQGRAFIASAPTAREIAAATGAPAMDPIRVYVGLRSADTPEARAEIALRELIRVGGFERSVLVVASPTGTGWMDPGAHDTLDFMLAGDVATVGVQYSYLSSPLAVTFYPELGIDQTRALFEAVYDHWTGLPEETRPRLYAFGLSAGAFNVQSTLSLLDMLADPVDGAFWAGSPFLSPYWQIVRERRDGGSPIWRPRFGDGSAVRTMNQDGEGDAPQAPWGPIRFVFLQYGSDPIVFFSPDDAIRRPAWLRAPRAPDVAPQIRWVPIVTMLQTALDITIAVQVPRFGHYYAAEDYLDGWAALLSPPGWSPQRARAVREAATARIANP